MKNAEWTARDLPTGKLGGWEIERKTLDAKDGMWAALDAAKGRGNQPGAGQTVTVLRHGPVCVMSDTTQEHRQHFEPIYQATGRVLVHGLGLGCFLNAILQKRDVTFVDVIELESDVISLVAPYYFQKYGTKRLRIRHDDAFTWKPKAGERWNVAWHDIWHGICADNLDEMAKLHRRFARRVDWQDSWGKYECQRERHRWSNLY